MSVSYQAMIVVGLPTEEVKIDQEESEDHGLGVISPYYDAGWENSLVGIPINLTSDYSWKELKVLEMPGDIEKAKAKFKQAVGLEPRVFLTPYGW